MEQRCKYCKKLIIYKKGKQFGAHVSNCKDNPNFWKGLEKIKKKYLERSTRKNYNFICKCGKHYILNLTLNAFKKNNFRKHCSQNCANSRIQTEEQNKNRSLKLKGIKNKYKGVNYIKRYGKLKAENLKKQKQKIKNINQIQNVLKNVFYYDDNIIKTQFFNNKFTKKELGHENTIRRTLKR